LMSRELRLQSFGSGSDLLTLAGDIVQLPIMSPLPDSLRLTSYRGAQLERVRQQVLANAPIDTAFERMALAATFAAWKEALPPNDVILRAALGYGSVDPDAEAARIIAQ